MLDFGIGGGNAGWIEFKPSKAAWRMPNADGDVADANWKYAIFHLDQIKMGYQRWQDGQPEWVWDAAGIEKASPPDADGEWKRGFEVHLTLLDEDMNPSSDELRFNASQVGTRKGMRELYKQYHEELPKNKGKSCVVQNLGCQSQKASSIPILRIIKWVDNPADDFPVEFN